MCSCRAKARHATYTRPFSPTKKKINKMSKSKKRKEKTNQIEQVTEKEQTNPIGNWMKKSPLYSILIILGSLIGMTAGITKIHGYYKESFSSKTIDVAFYEYQKLNSQSKQKLDYEKAFTNSILSGYNTEAKTQFDIKSYIRQKPEWKETYFLKLDSNNLVEVPYIEKEIAFSNPTKQTNTVHSLMVEVKSPELNKSMRTFHYEVEGSDAIDEEIMIIPGESKKKKVKFFFEEFKSNYKIIQSDSYEITLYYMDNENNIYSKRPLIVENQHRK